MKQNVNRNLKINIISKVCNDSNEFHATRDCFIHVMI